MRGSQAAARRTVKTVKIFFEDECGHRKADSFDAFVFPIATTLRFADRKLNGYFERFGKAAFENLRGAAKVPLESFVPLRVSHSVLVPVAHHDICKDSIPEACEFWLNIMKMLVKAGFHCIEMHPVLWLAGMKIGEELEGMAKAADLLSSETDHEACAIIPSVGKLILNRAMVAKVMRAMAAAKDDISLAIKSVEGSSCQNLYLFALGHSELQS